MFIYSVGKQKHIYGCLVVGLQTTVHQQGYSTKLKTNKQKKKKTQRQISDGLEVEHTIYKVSVLCKANHILDFTLCLVMTCFLF